MVALPARSILLADDDPGLRESLAEALGRAGWKTVTATAGDEAVDLLRVRVVRVALVDLHMPGLSGLDTLHALHGIEAVLPIVAMTADRDRWRREDVMAAGAFDLLWKPLRVASVLETLERALCVWDSPRGGDARAGAGSS